MTKDIFYGDDGLCKFIKSDPVALAYQVLDGKTTLTYDIKGMLIKRLLSISGEPSRLTPWASGVIAHYDSEGKADVADLAVRIRSDARSGDGRNKALDCNGLYAVTID
jgi:hypothetical protein